MENDRVLQVVNLKKYYTVNDGWFSSGQRVKAVDDVSFSIYKGETVGLVGESGCGKSTTGRTVLQLSQPTSGKIIFEGTDISKLKGQELRQIRRRIQMIFQDPYASLDPHKTIQQILTEPLHVHHLYDKKKRIEKVRKMLKTIGLTDTYLTRYPNELSGGQRQRIAIARAVILHPLLIVADEPVSALDVSVQAQVINLLMHLQHEFQLTYLFISHDLNVVRHITDRIIVMYLGKMVEAAPTEELFRDPKHPYTRALLSAIPIRNPDEHTDRIVLNGEVPSPVYPPSGCPFHERCPNAMDICSKAAPRQVNLSEKHKTICHLYS
ncbi:dipeptide ABC transporter ATP-binding protein [Sporolactobacillus shoreicorticis]|uniref:ABC transporter ATP-binding protein n=1 Tax=Sporolactobacillus shoreicorticis TaxID=1923877 RepID=A0ABW5S3N9_9BACL|nr:dipeptide ABC transporter ATP-binding protein [Sporolactobacillus shoreicorticis]MCO7124267.1 dipeptide ABC transporter ATP-binding protein [Sporolactobacillus shoreicorticis]